MLAGAAALYRVFKSGGVVVVSCSVNSAQGRRVIMAEGRDNRQTGSNVVQ